MHLSARSDNGSSHLIPIVWTLPSTAPRLSRVKGMRPEAALLSPPRK